EKRRALGPPFLFVAMQTSQCAFAAKETATSENPFTSKFCSPHPNWFNLPIILKAYPESVATQRSVQRTICRLNSAFHLAGICSGAVSETIQ
ncbi:hypothetical protein, partial [Marinobacter alexandrii]|uniref:hypothetical protein n=1 Tax=Marinobacter alexandrii TaxID=2570351 RepID=UPI003297204B